MIVNNKKDFDAQLQKGDKILALFYASWCSTCRNFMKTFDKTAADYGFKNVLYVNLDDYDNPLWDDYSINTVPSLILFENSKVMQRLDGKPGEGLGDSEVKEWLRINQA